MLIQHLTFYNLQTLQVQWVSPYLLNKVECKQNVTAWKEKSEQNENYENDTKWSWLLSYDNDLWNYEKIQTWSWLLI